ncbi:SLC13 family permease [Stackebrandtia nassauensis]|uniref:Citrate transporter n=1 Tax=Stackebrandtia nassauensis (strain DSM 44728 / CIP 108903 / NRRL B-16338 / NBRC 102104 / LLR-40K-21) TaxID=446470 RepID=D3Q732_STANL|nr:ArsB/NhaD family transporter [Stackebrandtia nassauensis]ADD40431.1 Citrate transporter [Stackebrandtia nassauensis DSM 44728]
MTWQAWAAIAVFSGAYVLIATEKINKVTAALGGAVLMFLIGASTADTAFFEQKTGIEWNVIFLLLGMMLIVAVLKRTGVFEFLAIWSAKRAKGRPFKVMVILVLVTAIASAALDNVTTVLLIAPVTFLVCERLNLPVVPFIIAEVMASNIGGTATLIGDPPNIIIAAQGELSFNDFLIHMAPLVVLLIVVFVGLCWLMFRKKFRYDPERVASIMALRERDAIKDPLLLIVSLTILGLVLAAFTLHTVLHVEASVVAMIGGLTIFAAAQVIASPVVMRHRHSNLSPNRLSGQSVFKDVEWETLAFFAGLFIMVGSLVHTGVIGTVASAASDAMGDNLLGASMVLLWASAVLSAIVDNIPYVATMAPIVDQLVNDAGNTSQSHVLWWALAFGADLGGNATAIGASANVVALGIAARAGHKISFWEFTKYGLVVTLVTISIVTPYLWLRYFVWA